MYACIAFDNFNSLGFSINLVKSGIRKRAEIKKSSALYKHGLDAKEEGDYPPAIEPSASAGKTMLIVIRIVSTIENNSCLFTRPFIMSYPPIEPSFIFIHLNPLGIDLLDFAKNRPQQTEHINN